MWEHDGCEKWSGTSGWISSCLHAGAKSAVIAFETPSGNCTAEVADALLSILRASILQIRMAGNADDADFCAMEANHIHNLPGILRLYSHARLKYYLDWAQSGYTAGFEKRFHRLPTMFMPFWQQLEAFLQNAETDRK